MGHYYRWISILNFYSNSKVRKFEAFFFVRLYFTDVQTFVLNIKYSCNNNLQRGINREFSTCRVFRVYLDGSYSIRNKFCKIISEYTSERRDEAFVRFAWDQQSLACLSSSNRVNPRSITGNRVEMLSGRCLDDDSPDSHWRLNDQTIDRPWDKRYLRQR